MSEVTTPKILPAASARPQKIGVRMGSRHDPLGPALAGRDDNICGENVVAGQAERARVRKPKPPPSVAPTMPTEASDPVGMAKPSRPSAATTSPWVSPAPIVAV